MHHVARLDWSFAEHADPEHRDLLRARPAASSSGPARGRPTRSWRSAHMDPGGWLARHVHSFEEALYVLEGELIIEIGRARPPAGPGRLRPDPDRRPARDPRQRRTDARPLAVA